MRGDQKMHVVRHDYVCVEIVVFQIALAIEDGVYNHRCELWLTKAQGACAGVVEKAVHGHECLA